MNETPGGLSDALRDLADGRSGGRGSGASPPPREGRRQGDGDGAAAAAGEEPAGGSPVADETGAPRPTRSGAYRATPRPRRRGGGGKAVDAGPAGLAAAALLAVGLVMLIPAVWGTLLLSGVHVWRHAAAEARSIAVVMLVCYPLAGLLVLGAGFYFARYRKAKRGGAARRGAL